MTTEALNLHRVSPTTFLERLTTGKPVETEEGIKARQDAIVFLLLETKGIIEHEVVTPVDTFHRDKTQETAIKLHERYLEIKDAMEARFTQLRLSTGVWTKSNSRG